MKKKLVAALVAATMVLSLAACGGKGDGGSSGGWIRQRGRRDVLQ